MKHIAFLAALITLNFSQTASASVLVVFDDFDDGVSSFNTHVTGAGGTVETQALGEYQSATYSDFNIVRATSNTIADVGGSYYLSNSSPDRYTTSGIVNIGPAGPNTIPRQDPLLYKSSGITFNFVDGINALGFEVGDWATCCQPSNLYIQFGNGTPIQVGASNTLGDQFLTNGGAGVFVAAFDDTDTFKTVSFWGDGIGEALYAGGTIRYSAIDLNSLPPTTGAVPEPTTWVMLLAGFGAIGIAMRRRKPALAVSYG